METLDCRRLLAAKMTKKCKSLFINLLTSIYSHIKTVDVKEIISLLDVSVCGKFRSNQIMTKVLYLQGVTMLVASYQNHMTR